MKRRLNVRFLVRFLAVTAALGLGVHLLHGVQVRRNADHFLATARLFSLEAGDRGQALVYFQHYLTIEPQDVAARVEYALTLESKGRNNSQRLLAVAQMERILAEDSSQDPIRFRLVLNLIELERLGPALAQLEKFGPTWAKPAELQQMRGQCLETLKKYAEATTAYERAVDLDAGRIDSYESWARLLLRLPSAEGEQPPDEKVRAVLDRMVAANAGNFQAYLTRASFLGELGFPKESKDALDAAVRLAAGEPDVALALADWHLGQGDAKAARLLVEESQGKHPRHLGLLKAHAGLDMRAGKNDDAIGLLRDAVVDLPAATDLSVLLIELLIDKKQLEEAKRRLDILHAEGNASLLAGYLKARLAIENKQWAEALGLLELVRSDLSQTSDWQSRLHALLGLCYQQLGDTEQQLVSFRRAVRKEPGWAEARYGLAAALAQSGRLEESLLQLADLRASNEATARLPGLDLLYARTLLWQTLRRPERERNWEPVNRAILGAGKRGADASELALLRAELLAGEKRFAEAETALAAARAAHPKTLAYRTIAADLAARQNHFDRATHLLDEAQKDLGDSLELRLARVRLWTHAGGHDPATNFAKFTQGTEGWSKSSRTQLLRRLAGVAQQLGEVKQAEQFWRQVAALEPRDIRSRAALLEIALEENDVSAARTSINQLRDLEGEDGAWWHYGTAALLMREGKKHPAKLEEARKLLDRLAAQHRDWSRLPLLRARIEETRGNLEAALVHYQEALRLGESDPRLVRLVVTELAARRRIQEADDLLVLLEEQGPLPLNLARLGTDVALALPNPGKARHRALRPINLESNDYRVQTWLVSVYRALGDDVEAEKLARKAAAQHPGTPDTWIALVTQLARMGRREEAEKLAEQAVKKVPAPAAAFTLARCYEALGERDKAEEAFVKGWKNQPDDFILAMQAVAFFQRGDQMAKARPLLEGLLQPGSLVPREFRPRLYRQLALALVETDNALTSKAMAVLDLNGKAGADSPTNQRMRAVVASYSGMAQAEESIRLFKESQKRAPASDEELYLFASLYERAGITFEAVDILEQLALAQPENAQFLARLTILLPGQGRLTEARTTLDRLERLEPDSFRSRQARQVIERGI